MKHLSPTELAYLAGFFDADGCVGTLTQIFISQKDRVALDFWQRKTGLGVVNRASNPGPFDHPTRCIHRWCFGKVEAAEFLSALYPFLMVKRDQAKVFLRCFESKNKEVRRLGRDLLKQLKRNSFAQKPAEKE